MEESEGGGGREGGRGGWKRVREEVEESEGGGWKRVREGVEGRGVEESEGGGGRE